MTDFAIALLTISAGTWIGAIVFQSAVVAPAVFVDLDERAARSLLRTLFPRFFRLGLVCGALMLAALAITGVASDWSATVVVLLVVTTAMIGLELVSLWMVPHINAARDAGEAGQQRFSKLHRLSVLLTIVILALGVGILFAIGGMAAEGM